MKKINRLYILTFALSLCLVSCKKNFLDVPDKQSILRQAYVKDLTTLEHYLIGTYSELTANFFFCSTIIHPELSADNIKSIDWGMIPQYTWTQLADDDKALKFGFANPNANGLWFSGYRIVRDCDFVLEEVGKYQNESSGKANSLKGQALGLRALVHSILVNVFAQPYNFTSDASHPGIPYIKTSDWTEHVSRSTVKEVYTQIIADLNEAIPLLPASGLNKTYFNKNAAKALLARIYLFKEDYTNAKDVAVQVARDVPLMLTNYPAALFTPQETEALFQAPPLEAGINGVKDPTYFAGALLDSDFLLFTATEDIATLLTQSPTDVRIAWVQNNGTSWQIMKFPKNVEPQFSSPAASYYQTILRSSEMYLTAAEAYGNLNLSDSAVYYLDAVRQRADPLVPTTTVTGSMLMDSIYQERRKELAFEGLRMFDLLRWKKGVVRTDVIDPAYKTLPYPSNFAIAPIPTSDVEKNGLVQNLGY